MEDNLKRTRLFWGCRLSYHHDIKYYMSMQDLWQMGRESYFSDYDTRDRDEYLNGCNGLLLLLNSTTHQFYVCNPITRQQVAIPKACMHKNQDDFCAAFAFDPSESPHNYRVLRIDYSAELANSSTSLVDIFSSEYGHWIRHRLQLDSSLTKGFKSCKLCRQFFYLRGKLYSITLSWKLLCIDIKTVQACTLELPVPKAHRNGAVGCLGMSRDRLCCMKHMPDESGRFHSLVVWSCDNGQWIPRYSVRCHSLAAAINNDLGYDYDDNMEPYAISPSSDLLFFGTATLICCIYLKSEKIKLVGKTLCALDTPACFLTLRACFVPLNTSLRKRNCVSCLLNMEAMSSEGTYILSVEESNGIQEDVESVEVIDVKLYDKLEKEPTPSLQVYPSEIMGMHLELEQISPHHHYWFDDDDDDGHLVDEFEGVVASKWKKRKITG